MNLSELYFTIPTLRKLYREGVVTVSDVIDEALRRAAQPHVWITLLSREEVMTFVEKLTPSDIEKLPLFGVPFAIKDNIDLAGVPTTAACPEFAFTPERSATVVERLMAAGAIPIGKTNMDQFATGLVGTRTPHGACSSVFDPRYISGGSSSGSAVAVASGMVAFSLGTDTAGSGRVPAAFNNIVGLKPSKGVLSTRGVFPACRSLDCVSIFAISSADARVVFDAAAGTDSEDAFSRVLTDRVLTERPRFGVPKADQLEFFGDADAARLFEQSATRLTALGCERVEIDFAPFRETAALLYAGPWVAERRHALGDFLDRKGEAMDPTVRAVIGGADKYSARDAFDAAYKLQALTAAARAEWGRMDVLLLPTAGTTYTIAEVQADPIRLNSNLGFYTNFVNLLDLAAIAVPGGFRGDGLPFGVTLMAPAFSDRALLALGDRLHRAGGGNLGVTSAKMADQPEVFAPVARDIFLTVVGAHLSGMPLNHQLTSRGARFVKATQTAPTYRLYALANTTPPKPGLVRTTDPQARGIEVEVWALSEAAFGSFVAEVPAPMTIGTVELADGSTAKGFACEPCALDGGIDITEHGGWRAYLADTAASGR